MVNASQMQTAHAFALQALAGAGVRHLAAAEFDDPDVHSVHVVIDREGSLVVQLHNRHAGQVGEYTL